MTKPQHWSVRVEADGELLLNIESNCLCGKADLTDEDEAVIRNAAAHLTSFVGPEPRAKGKSYIAEDGAHIVETPSGHTFINPEDWY